MKTLLRRVRLLSRTVRGIAEWWLKTSALAAFELSARPDQIAEVVSRSCAGACGESTWESVWLLDQRSFLAFHQFACPACRSRWGLQAYMHLRGLGKGQAEEKRELGRFVLSTLSEQNPISAWAALLRWCLRAQCQWFREWRSRFDVTRTPTATLLGAFLRACPLLLTARLAARHSGIAAWAAGVPEVAANPQSVASVLLRQAIP